MILFLPSSVGLLRSSTLFPPPPHHNHLHVSESLQIHVSSYLHPLPPLITINVNANASQPFLILL